MSPLGAIPSQPATSQIQPITSGSYNTGTVNTTGGIINSHPVDIFNHTTTYQPPESHSEDVTAEPAYPVEQIMLTPNVSELNSNASSVQYNDRRSGPFNLGIDVDWVLTSNLFNNFSSTQTTAGNYFDVSVPVGFVKKTATTNFNAYFRNSNTFYPAYSSLNHSSQIYSQDLQHKSSALTTWDWSMAGGRIISLDDYLPPVIAIGNTGVTQSSLASGLLPLYNGASTLAVTHRLTEEDTVSGSVTAGWTQEPLSAATSTQPAFLNREATGAVDLQYQRALNPYQSVGVELTDVYVKGLSPVGTSNFTSAQITFHQAFTKHGSLNAGIGPLYSHSASTYFPVQNDYSYTGNLGVSYQTSYARFDAGYARLFQLGYLAPAAPAHSLYATIDRPITPKMDLVLDTRYILALAPPHYQGGQYSDFATSLRLGYNITPNTTFYVNGAIFRQAGQGINIGRNDFTTGMSYTFGNPLTRSGGR
ncbi:hypothetical protein C7378_0522 [Acidipila rosea]|uniref:Beta-barrel porin 2 n=1 Tax=Acidipila rosea TaxID=768535 RepID=A0A4R1LAQ6_9BACT|nr:hypothetical protein C7378_0522 [Acidipila rosea]